MKHKDKMTILAFLFGPITYLLWGKWGRFVAFIVLYSAIYAIEKYFGLPDSFFATVYFAMNVFIIIQIRDLADKEERELKELKRRGEERRQKFREFMEEK